MPEPTPASLRIAVLMDSDNVSPKFAPLILEELATYGTPTIKRAYGDWTTTNLNGWKKALNHHAIQPVQQFAYTVGKNSSDSALIIDAMDLLWMGNVDAFALVSSDSDFTRLATRLREGGKRVIGLGARKTPASLRNAVDQFIYLELLGTATDHDVDDDETGEDAPAKEENAKASEGSGRSGSRRGGRGRGRGSKTTDAADTPEATDADAEAPAADEAPAGDAAADTAQAPGEEAGAAHSAQVAGTEAFLVAEGFTPVQRSRRVAIAPGAIGLPDVRGEEHPDGVVLEEASTGSVELTRAVTAFYDAVHAWDPSTLSVGAAQQLLLGPATGAAGAVVLRDAPKAEGGRIRAFAVSYTPERQDAPADVLVGWDPELGEKDALQAVADLLALLVAQYPVQIEVDEAMAPLERIVDGLIGGNAARTLVDTYVFVDDAPGA